jgi:hypothetical protein
MNSVSLFQIVSQLPDDDACLLSTTCYHDKVASMKQCAPFIHLGSRIQCRDEVVIHIMAIECAGGNPPLDGHLNHHQW